ncbi:STAS domain-containing protein [Kitasatospora sp. KL5]|uniref:STAS domain-containing protein n=1 Tax=Kitasatospora sp. KL5 TaxID=3425125 RepID=UPI003D6E56CF
MYANGHGRILLDLPFEPGARAITVSRRSGQVVLGVRGSLDGATAPTLREALLSELAREPHQLVVDLSELDFWDSCGMSAVVVAHKSCRGRRTAVAVAGLQGSAAASYRATNLDSVIPTYPDTASALAHGRRAAA